MRWTTPAVDGSRIVPFLVLSLSPSDKSTLRILKSVYFNLDDMDNYTRIKKQLESQ